MQPHKNSHSKNHTLRSSILPLANPGRLVTINREVFCKDQNEVMEIKKLKKQHNKMFKSFFGTKRPTAGIVQRHFFFAQ